MFRSTAALGQESMMRNLALLCSFLFVLCSGLHAGPVDTARRNGVAAQEALLRSRRVLHAYLERLDPVTGLLPRNGSQPAWFVRDSAADLYPFLVMAAWFTDRPVFEREMTDILRNEIRHSTRVGMLSDGGDVLVIEVSAWNEPPYGGANK